MARGQKYSNEFMVAIRWVLTKDIKEQQLPRRNVLPYSLHVTHDTTQQRANETLRCYFIPILGIRYFSEFFVGVLVELRELGAIHAHSTTILRGNDLQNPLNQVNSSVPLGSYHRNDFFVHRDESFRKIPKKEPTFCFFLGPTSMVDYIASLFAKCFEWNRCNDNRSE